MAEFLAGNAEHKAHAPLSSGQTMAVCQFLNGRTDQAFTEISELRNGMDRSLADMNKLLNEFSVVNGSLQEVKREIQAMGDRVDSANGSSKQSMAGNEKLKQGLKAAREDIMRLRDGQKVTNTNVQNVKEELQSRGDDIKQIRADVDNFVQVQFDVLQQKMTENTLSISQITQDFERFTKDFYAQKEKVRELNQDMIATKGNLGRVDKQLGEETTKLKQACKDLETTTTNLEVTNAVVLKLNQAREQSDSDVDNLKEQMVQMGLRMDGMSATAIDNKKAVGQLREEVMKNKAEVETQRLKLTSVQDQVNQTMEVQQKHSTNIGELGKDLAKLRSLAEKTRDGLEATNAMVLPNLGTAGGLPNVGLNSPKEIARALGKQPEVKTPRRRREATWMTRNVGLVPDRMSYI